MLCKFFWIFNVLVGLSLSTVCQADISLDSLFKPLTRPTNHTENVISIKEAWLVSYVGTYIVEPIAEKHQPLSLVWAEIGTDDFNRRVLRFMFIDDPLNRPDANPELLLSLDIDEINQPARADQRATGRYEVHQSEIRDGLSLGRIFFHSRRWREGRHLLTRHYRWMFLSQENDENVQTSTDLEFAFAYENRYLGLWGRSNTDLSTMTSVINPALFVHYRFVENSIKLKLHRISKDPLDVNAFKAWQVGYSRKQAQLATAQAEASNVIAFRPRTAKTCHSALTSDSQDSRTTNQD